VSGPSRLVAFARAALDEGPVLFATGDFAAEMAMAGADICDHNLPAPNGPGLWLFEGWLEYGPDPEPDIYLAGEWRRLSHWEMCRVRHGMAPWDEPPATAKGGRA